MTGRTGVAAFSLPFTGGYLHRAWSLYRCSSMPLRILFLPASFLILLAAGIFASPALTAAEDARPAAPLYHEALRPQFHFTARYWNDYKLNPQQHQEGWINDVNGLVYLAPEYHLFAQRWWSCWLHAVSADLIHWKELPPAFGEGGEFGGTQSGGGVIDSKNTSGLGTGETPLMVAFWASTDNLHQCISYSNDKGLTWTKYAKNPVLTHPERDPKVCWYEPAKEWVMVLAGPNHTFCFFTSKNLLEWKETGEQIAEMYECPDFFQLPVDGDATNKRWVLIDGSGSYRIGSFDGSRFTPETQKQAGDIGPDFYATMTWNTMPEGDNRRVQIAWMRSDSYPKDMPFNQQISFPCELTLHSTPGGFQLWRNPVREISKIYGEAFELKDIRVEPGVNPLDKVQGELFDIMLTADLSRSSCSGFQLAACGKAVRYDVAERVLAAEGNHVSVSPVNGELEIRMLVDRLSLETFCNGGFISITKVVPSKKLNEPLSIEASGGQLAIKRLQVHQLRSIWE